MRRSLSRRTFLQSAAAIPLASSVEPAKRGTTSPPRVAVVGAGAFGGWTALELRRRGAEVVLVDAWGPGNSRASSGGETRVIRAMYGADQIYVDMVKRAYARWEQLDGLVDEPLYIETGALWMHRGDDAYVRAGAPLLREAGFAVEPVPLAEAKRRWPQIEFAGIRSVWLEQRAGVLSARRSCAVVRDVFENAGGMYRAAHVEPGTIENAALSALLCDDGSRIEADAYVFACGPWLGRLFPEVLGDAIRPTRQEVLFFGAPRGSRRYAPPALPVWIDFGERIFYGIPDTHARGFKIADDTRGDAVDPTKLERVVTQESIARARRLLAERFPELANAPLLESRVCQYENSPDGHLVVDRHPGVTNVWLVGGGSGHGFKLGPAVGEMVAEAVLANKPAPATFGLARLAAAQKPATQFNRK